MRDAVIRLGHGYGRPTEGRRLLLSGRIRLVHPTEILPRDPSYRVRKRSFVTSLWDSCLVKPAYTQWFRQSMKVRYEWPKVLWAVRQKIKPLMSAAQLKRSLRHERLTWMAFLSLWWSVDNFSPVRSLRNWAWQVFLNSHLLHLSKMSEGFISGSPH